MKDGRGERTIEAPTGGSTIALIRGRSGRAVLASTARNLLRGPVFLASYVGRRDRSLWVFGNVHGFRDSPRYLAEHVLHSSPQLKPVWIAHTAAEADAVRAAGLEVALRDHPEARRILRRAGVAFFTHGFRDLDLPLVFGAHIVYLWHGTPLKRVGLDVSVVQAKRRPLRVRLAARLVRWFHARAYGLVGTFVAASELDKERFVTAFGAPPRRVVVLGSPRFDVIRGGPEYQRVAGEGDLRLRLGYRSVDFIVLWLPTHRREYGGDEGWLPQLTDEMLDECLGGTNIKLLVKTHPNADFEVYRERLPQHPRVRLFAEAEVDVNCLLQVADSLVSDYSSAVFDYAILGRPIHFLAPDIESYDADRGLYDPYDRLTGGLHRRDWPSLLLDLVADRDGGDQASGADLSRRVSEYCRNHVGPDACRRIVVAIIAASGADRS